jgi:hypothetical protein
LLGIIHIITAGVNQSKQIHSKYRMQKSYK